MCEVEDQSQARTLRAVLTLLEEARRLKATGGHHGLFNGWTGQHISETISKLKVIIKEYE